jgi:hypothetical protein
MFSHLTIDDDPTIWVLAQAVDGSPLTQAGSTVSIPVIAPLAGTLLLSRRAATVTVFTYGDGEDVIPSEAKLANPVVYVPTATGLNNGSPVYVLPSTVDLAALTSDLVAAMKAGSLVTIDYGGPVGGGVLTVNGGTLSFVVLCPVNPGK